MKICLVETTGNESFVQALVAGGKARLGMHTEFVIYTQESEYKNLLESVRTSNLVVCEATQSSTELGLSVALALQFYKPVVLFYEKRAKLPVFEYLLDPTRDNIQVIAYDRFSLKKEIRMALCTAVCGVESRFNFFITPEIGVYLNWVAKHYRLPRSVYLRRLIEQDLKHNIDYVS